MLKFRKYLVIARTSLQNNLAYRTNFIFGSLFYALIIFIFLQLWKTIYSGGNGVISGFSLTQMIWYCVITEMIGLSSSNIFSELNNEIKSGSITYLLNKPYDYILYQFSNSMGVTLIKLMINAVMGILLGTFFVGPLPQFDIRFLPLIGITMFTGICINFFLMGAIGLTAFWMEENSAFFWIYQKLMLMLGVFLPIDFFPQWLQGITRYLPFAFITYGPAKLVVDFSIERYFQVVTGQLIYLLAVLFLVFLVYGKGVKKLNVNGG